MNEQTINILPNQLDKIKRILERHVLYEKTYFREGFRNHPEAAFNPNLLVEHIEDMTLCANIYNKLGLGNIYENVDIREQGKDHPLGPPSEDDLLKLAEEHKEEVEFIEETSDPKLDILTQDWPEDDITQSSPPRTKTKTGLLDR